jgi:hemolysin activation/secretion protein
VSPIPTNTRRPRTPPATRWLWPALLPLSALAQEAATGAGPAAPQAAADEAPFAVLEYRVLGNTTLPRREIESAVYPFLGESRTFADVESARQELENAYRRAGYGTVFVDVPEQEVQDGVVRLRVTEGRLDRVRITGARYFANADIREALPSLESRTVPNLPAVQAELAQLNAVTGDRVVVPVLKAGRTPGTVDVELKVDDALPLHGSLELNDRNTASTTDLRLTAAVSYANLFQRQHSFNLQYQMAPEEPSETSALVASYVFRTEALPRTTIALYAVDTSSDVAALGTLAVIGQGRIFGARAIRSLQDSPAYSHNLTLGVDYKDFLEDIRLQGDEGLVTPIRYLNWSLAYGGTRRFESGLLTLNAAANFGLRRILNDADEFADKRFLGSPNYFYVTAGGQYERRLPWGFSAVARLATQFTQTPLVNNEQLAIGGADTVRGYFEASQLGDYGFNGSLELRHSGLSKLLRVPEGAAYTFAFYDAGIVSILQPLPSQTSQFDLASWGFGVRLLGWHGLALSADWVRALTPAGAVLGGDQRTHFNLRYSF